MEWERGGRKDKNGPFTLKPVIISSFTNNGEKMEKCSCENLYEFPQEGVL